MYYAYDIKLYTYKLLSYSIIMYYAYDIKLYTIVYIKSTHHNFEVIMNMNIQTAPY